MFGRINVLKKREEQSKKRMNDAFKVQQAVEASIQRKQIVDKRKQQLQKKAADEKQQKIYSTANAKMKRDEALAKRKKDK